jgi:imidazolonepropionase-like amidohydrolase
MPGLIDLHTHAYTCGVNSRETASSGRAYQTAFAAKMLGHALDCGFTTLRDIGGCDWSLARVISTGLIRGPRFFYAGKVFATTDGHGNSRPMSDEGHSHGICNCGQIHSLRVIAGRSTHRGDARAVPPWGALLQDHGGRRCVLAQRPGLNDLCLRRAASQYARC